MTDFKPINTQEEFNQAIKERIQREADKYKDYEEIKQQNTSYAEQLKEMAALKTQVATYEEASQKNKTLIDELNAKVKGYETSSVKTRVALEEGLSYEMASRLNGEDEESIRKDARTLASIIKMNKPTPPSAKAEGDQVKADDSKAAYRSLIKGLRKDK